MDDELEPVTSVVTLRPRPRDAHKGDFGHVLVVGGSRGMIGAVALAANASLRAGAGLASFAAPAGVQPVIAGLCPCATSFALDADPDGTFAPSAAAQLRQIAEGVDVLAVGPGMAVGPAQRDLVRAALELGKPLVLDADGLNNLAHIDDWPALLAGPAILTPHPGEFSRLTNQPTAQVQADRVNLAAEAARRWRRGDRPLVCVLKGAATVVTDGRRVYVNATGNPGMASGGTGDVLTGVTAGLLGQGLAPFDAACLAVWCHGRAGDLAAARVGEVSLIATDLLDELPSAMREVAAPH
jgi:NAD(P)H-hydrate epimerase